MHTQFTANHKICKYFLISVLRFCSITLKNGSKGYKKKLGSNQLRKKNSSKTIPDSNEALIKYYSPPLQEHQEDIRSMGKYSITGSWSHYWSPYTIQPDGSVLPSVGYEVPYKFKITDPHHSVSGKMVKPANRDTSSHLNYTDFTGNRFPTLSTAENYRYWKDTGIDRLSPRVFPIKLPLHRRIDPMLREYIYFLHSLDPQRFTFRRIGERYMLKEKTVERIYKEYSLKQFFHKYDLCTDKTRRITRAEAVLQLKELIYSEKLRYKQIGDEKSDSEEDDDEFKGWKSTYDWIKRQSVTVEAIKAFPIPESRNPIPKRVDVDVCVDNTADYKIINWIDPNDAVIF